MLLTNIKVYFKFLSRNKAYTVINLVGFSVALVFVILLGLYVKGENSFDKFHEKGDRIFRLLEDNSRSSWAALVAEHLALEYPEIESFTRVSTLEMVVSGGGVKEKVKTNALAVDSAFFSMFSFPMAAGDPALQLRAPDAVTLSESFAVRLFGYEDPMGQTITIDGKPHTVTGVIRDFEKTHFVNPDIIVNFRDHAGEWYFKEGGYTAANFPLYVLEREGTDLRARADDMADFLRQFFWMYQKGVSKDVHFEPVTETYFNPESSSYDFNFNDRGFIRLLSAAALAVLLFALINYVNLSVALGGFRAREAATRRLLGATRGGLFGIYIMESVLFCFIALTVAMLLAGIVEPVFNKILQSEISLVGELKNPAYIALSAGAALVLGIMSGIVPSLVITRWKPIDVVKGEFTRKTRMIYSRIFIGLQFCLTIVLIGSAITIIRQTNYMRTTDLGFDKSMLVRLENVLSKQQLQGLRDVFMQISGVEMVSFTAGSPAGDSENMTVFFEDGTQVSYQVIIGDSLLFPTLGLEIVNSTGNSSKDAIWLNETAAHIRGVGPDDDYAYIWKDNEATPLAGIVRDFHIQDLSDRIPPMIIGNSIQERYGVWEILIKIAPGNPVETFRQLKQAYSDYNGGEPFAADFVDEKIDKWYDAQRRTGKLVGAFTLMAILISAMGLVAMTTYFMRQRARDIAVRKVFGATNGQVLRRLVFGFLKIVAVAFVIAVPIIWWMMKEWLSSFAYHIPLSWTIFALAGILAGSVAFIAVFWQSRIAANRNPVKSLKSE